VTGSGTKLRLLCIANPARYGSSVTDIPLSYARLAAHPRVELYHAETEAMMHGEDRIQVIRVPVGFMPDEFRTLPERQTVTLPLSHFDLAFDRTLKPFPDGLYDHLKRFAAAGMRFVNDPTGIERQLNPGFLLTAAAGRLPPALLTGDAVEAAGFFVTHGTVVAKRPNSCGGREVFRLTAKGDGSIATDNIVEGQRCYADFQSLFRHLSRNRRTPVLFARYLRRVREGDKRIVAVGGEPYGAYLRRAADGHWVQNVSRGGTCEITDVSDADHALVTETSRAYLEAGIHVLGYDLLRDDTGGWLISEINAGNIGGLFRLEYLGVPGVTDRFVDWLRRFSNQTDRMGRLSPLPMPSENFLETYR
jgi:glutathione synthase/RimK-type ligase-like ATP-grasp enzyme